MYTYVPALLLLRRLYFRFGALFSRRRRFCFLYCDVYMYLWFRGCPVVLDIELSVSSWYQKTRRALLHARCLLLLLLLLAVDNRERQCAVCGITFKITCNEWSGNKTTILCQSEHERIPPHPKHTHIKKHLCIYGNSLYGPARWIHTKGDTSDMAIVQPTEHPRTSPPGSKVSEHMPRYPSCVCLP